MEVQESAQLFVALGATFLIGLAADAVGRRTRLPRVTLLLVLGFLIGPACLDLLPETREAMFQLAASIALTMVGFLLGEKLGHAARGPDRFKVLVISVTVVVVTALVVFAGLSLLGGGALMALLLAGISTATAPAATVDVVREARVDSRFSRILLAIVAVDDAWGLLLFSLLLACGDLMLGKGADAWGPLRGAGYELGAAVVLGALLGVAMAYLSGRIEKGEPSMLEAIGFVFLACGLALRQEASFILTAMTMGTVVSVLARHHRRPFHVIEKIELPFMILFFVLAGAALEPASLGAIGWLGLAYVLLRAGGRVAGGWLGGKLCGADAETRRWIGWALMPQAGVALGMALVAAERFPSVGTAVLQITIGATVVFEILGPLLTRAAVFRTRGG